MTRVARTVIVKSIKPPRKVFRVFIELEEMYCNMVEQLTMYAVRNNVKSFTKLKLLKYREMRTYILNFHHITSILHAKMLPLELRAFLG